MTNKEPIAHLPQNAWETLILGLTNLMTSLKRGEAKEFLVKFKFGSVTPPPYVGAKLIQDDILLMFPGDAYLNPDLTRIQKSQLNGLGWSAPRGAQSNYSKLIKGNLPMQTSAMYLVATLRLVFEVPLSTHILLDADPALREYLQEAGLRLCEGSANCFKMT
jgi:hypothetical protein